MRYFGFPVLPLVLGVVLGRLIESNYRRSLVLSGGDYAIFLEDPISHRLLRSRDRRSSAGSLVSEWRRAKAARKENARRDSCRAILRTFAAVDDGQGLAARRHARHVARLI